MTKTLGQVAQCAFHETMNVRAMAGQGVDKGPAWQAAAEAVAMEEAKRLRNSGMAGDATKAERRVIEAAKALCIALDVRSMEELVGVPNWLRKVIEPVEISVEALQEVE